jgi:hypothetical protein
MIPREDAEGGDPPDQADTPPADLTCSGPDLVTGGAFGPEAGLLGVGAVLLGIHVTVACARYHLQTAVRNRDALRR